MFGNASAPPGRGFGFGGNTPNGAGGGNAPLSVTASKSEGDICDTPVKNKINAGAKIASVDDGSPQSVSTLGAYDLVDETLTILAESAADKSPQSVSTFSSGLPPSPTNIPEPYYWMQTDSTTGSSSKSDGDMKPTAVEDELAGTKEFVVGEQPLEEEDIPATLVIEKVDEEVDTGVKEDVAPVAAVQASGMTVEDQYGGKLLLSRLSNRFVCYQPSHMRICFSAPLPGDSARWAHFREHEGYFEGGVARINGVTVKVLLEKDDSPIGPCKPCVTSAANGRGLCHDHRGKKKKNCRGKK